MEPDTLGTRIAQSRRELGLRLRRDMAASDLAALLGVTPATIYRWEGDKKVPRPDALLRLADVLGVRPAYLLFGQEPKSAETLTPAADLLKRLGIEPRGQVPLTPAQARAIAERAQSAEQEHAPTRKAAGKKRRR